ncbi:MAG: beta-N-acetylhexosaminidase [Phycisphaerales bacterium]
MRTFLLCSLLLLSSACYCQDTISIIPAPLKIKQKTGYFQVSASTAVFSDQETKKIARDFGQALSLSSQICPNVPDLMESEINCIQFKLNANLDALGLEGYRLEVKENNILIESSAIHGVFYGMQTLKQLFPVEIYAGQMSANRNFKVPCCIIEDMPRFKWRGLSLDVSRHFMPKEFVKKYIDLLAMHKMNMFHWHLTDDQGWRIEIKKYPKLTSIGAWRKETIVGYWNTIPHVYDGKPHGGFYTQDDIREIVAYAKQRCITIVPEIDMPGHVQAALGAYPQFGNTNEPLSVWTTWGVSENILNIDEETIQFCQDVLTEVFELFPDQYIHIGGDEVVTEQWEKNPKVQSRMKELGLKDESEIQPWFTKIMYSFVKKNNRILVGWEQILNDDLSGAIIGIYLGAEPAIKAVRLGCDVIMTPSTEVYLDKYQGDPKKEPIATGLTPLKKVYLYEPVPDELTPSEQKHILGVEGQVWTEYMPNPRHVEYMVFPRACAIAEVDWTAAKKKDYSDFCIRLKYHLKRLEKLNVNFRPISDVNE